jgi:hypothetical protein
LQKIDQKITPFRIPNVDRTIEITWNLICYYVRVSEGMAQLELEVIEQMENLIQNIQDLSQSDYCFHIYRT